MLNFSYLQRIREPTVDVEVRRARYATDFNGVLSGILNFRSKNGELVQVVFVLELVFTALEDFLRETE